MVDQVEARKLFDALDLGKNGALTRGELITALRIKTSSAGEIDVLGLGFANLDAVADWFAQSDVDQNSQLTVEEFIAALDAHEANS
ncbi:EF-hand domain-containing protein [Nocardia sp. NPDC059239]|uniref:EF-hand domain-containing protein n=1 Tax=unclassified Nocardia TaxID=2637762 RepID=UPI0036CAC807